MDDADKFPIFMGRILVDLGYGLCLITYHKSRFIFIDVDLQGVQTWDIRPLGPESSTKHSQTSASDNGLLLQLDSSRPTLHVTAEPYTVNTITLVFGTDEACEQALTQLEKHKSKAEAPTSPRVSEAGKLQTVKNIPSAIGVASAAMSRLTSITCQPQQSSSTKSEATTVTKIRSSMLDENGNTSYTKANESTPFKKSCSEQSRSKSDSARTSSVSSAQPATVEEDLFDIPSMAASTKKNTKVRKGAAKRRVERPEKQFISVDKSTKAKSDKRTSISATVEKVATFSKPAVPVQPALRRSTRSSSVTTEPPKLSQQVETCAASHQKRSRHIMAEPMLTDETVNAASNALNDDVSERRDNVIQIQELGTLDQHSHTNAKQARDCAPTEPTKAKRLRIEAVTILDDNAEESLYETAAVEHDAAISFANGNDSLPEIDMHIDDSGIYNSNHEGALQELLEGHTTLNLPQRVSTLGSPLPVDLDDSLHNNHDNRTMAIVGPALESATKVGPKSLSYYEPVLMTTPAVNTLQHPSGSDMVAPGFSVMIPSNRNLQLSTVVVDTGAGTSQAAMTRFHSNHVQTLEAGAQTTNEMKSITWDNTEDTLIMQLEDNSSVDGDIDVADGSAARLDAISVNSSVDSPSSSDIMSKSGLGQGEINVAAGPAASHPMIPAHQAMLQGALCDITQVSVPKV